MTCPYCGKEMRKGYLESRDGLGWREKKSAVKAFSGLLAEVRLGDTVTAHHCDACQVILIQYRHFDE